MKNALHSLFGGKVAAGRAAAIRSYLESEGVSLSDEHLREVLLLAKGKSALAGNVGASNRNQVVYTPTWLVEQLGRLGRIALDPCTEPHNPVGANRHYTEGGLDLPWASLYFCNPPYGDLGSWLEKAYIECMQGVRGWVLCPIRPNRAYWHAYTGVAHRVELRPFAFQGHTSAFPAPMCLLCYGAPVPKRLLDGKGRDLVLSVVEV